MIARLGSRPEALSSLYISKYFSSDVITPHVLFYHYGFIYYHWQNIVLILWLVLIDYITIPSVDF